MFYYLKCFFKTKTYPKYQRKEQIALQICCAVVRVLQVLLSCKLPRLVSMEITV